MAAESAVAAAVDNVAPAAAPVASAISPVANNYSGGAYFNLFGDEPAVPDANELLSLKILKDANPSAFSSLAQEETKWLSLALGLLRRDVYLQVMMGGKGVRQAMKLAGVLKQKAEQSHFNHRVNGVVERMLTTKFSDQGWGGLAPVSHDQIREFMAGSKNAIKIAPMNKSPFVYGSANNPVTINANDDGDIPMMSQMLNDGLRSTVEKFGKFEQR